MSGFVHLVDEVKAVKDVQKGGWFGIKWFVDGNIQVSK